MVGVDNVLVYVLIISSVQYRCPTGHRCSGSPVGRYIVPYKDNNIQWGICGGDEGGFAARPKAGPSPSSRQLDGSVECPLHDSSGNSLCDSMTYFTYNCITMQLCCMVIHSLWQFFEEIVSGIDVDMTPAGSPFGDSMNSMFL